MKNHHYCTKCSGKRIWVIEKYRIPGDSAEGRALPVVVHQPVPTKSKLFADLRGNPQGHIDLYICDACGYAELWAGGMQGLAVDPARGVRLLDTSDSSAGPFR